MLFITQIFSRFFYFFHHPHQLTIPQHSYESLTNFFLKSKPRQFYQQYPSFILPLHALKVLIKTTSTSQCSVLIISTINTTVAISIFLTTINLLSLALLTIPLQWAWSITILRLDAFLQLMVPNTIMNTTAILSWVNIKLHLMVRLKSWEFGVALWCHYSQIHSDLEWLYLLKTHLWIK